MTVVFMGHAFQTGGGCAPHSTALTQPPSLPPQVGVTKATGRCMLIYGMRCELKCNAFFILEQAGGRPPIYGPYFNIRDTVTSLHSHTHIHIYLHTHRKAGEIGFALLIPPIHKQTCCVAYIFIIYHHDPKTSHLPCIIFHLSDRREGDTEVGTANGMG